MHKGAFFSSWAVVFFSILLARPCSAQMVVKLSPETVAEFERYAKSAETELERRWEGKANFLSIDDSPGEKAKVMGGEFAIHPARPDGKPQSVTDGLIHDWVGTVFIPGSSPERVMEVLRNFDNHQKIYPEITDSKTLRTTATETVGYWRVQQRKGLVPVMLDIEQDAHYKQLSPNKWNCRAYARKIIETDKTPFGRGRRLPEGEGHGYLWKMYAYWSIEGFNGGVLAECRMLSLSRSIPQAVAWAVGPYVQKAPEESLLSTLKHTRDVTANSAH